MTSMDNDARHSSFREKMLEHTFLAELLQEGWLARDQTIDVLKPEVDNAGYDLVLECGAMRRYVQLKGSKLNGKASYKDVNRKLGMKPGGCVVWIFYANHGGRAQVSYRFFGNGVAECPDLGQKHGSGNSRRINIGRFDKPADVVHLFDKLFPKTQLDD